MNYKYRKYARPMTKREALSTKFQKPYFRSSYTTTARGANKRNEYSIPVSGKMTMPLNKMNQLLTSRVDTFELIQETVENLKKQLKCKGKY